MFYDLHKKNTEVLIFKNKKSISKRASVIDVLKFQHFIEKKFSLFVSIHKLVFYINS